MIGRAFEERDWKMDIKKGPLASALSGVLALSMVAVPAGIVVAGAILAVATVFTAIPATAGTIIDEWKVVEAPEPPKLKSVKLDTETTALIVMDIQKNNCNEKRRPRCLATLAGIKGLLEKARSTGITVVYTITSSKKVEDILKQVAPKSGEPYVKASVNKFYKTDLEKILKGKGIDTVILVGTSAEGAVLNTATGAYARKFKIVVPVDGMSSSKAYGEQYTAYHLANGPGVRKRTTLTTIDKIEF